MTECSISGGEIFQDLFQNIPYGNISLFFVKQAPDLLHGDFCIIARRLIGYFPIYLTG